MNTHETARMSMERLRASLADRYTLDRELGAGGMATVYLAHDIKHDRKVAVKVLRPELAAVIGAERFLAEIKTTANLQHPHILPLFDSGVARLSHPDPEQRDGEGSLTVLFYVMPYVEGISLRNRMAREKQLPINEAVRIASEVAAALDYAHRHGVIHRDIKPENIMLHDGSALVADFGIALAASRAGTRMTETGMSLGTPQYMSPEQAMGERELDARSDVYALGCVTYEMLTGEPPFTGPTAQAIIAKVMTTDPAEVTSLRKTVPANVADAVHTALQKVPADRFASAAEFSSALAGMLPTKQRPASSSRPGPPQAPARWQLWAMLVGGAAIGALGFSQLASSSATADTEPRFWSIALPDSEPLVAGRWLYDEALRSLDISEDGKTVVYGTHDQAGSRLVLVRTDNGTHTGLPNTAGATLPTLSPDGLSVAFVVDTQIRRLTLADGSVTRVGSGLFTYLTWDADDHLFAGRYNRCPGSVAANGGTIALLPAATCRVHELTAIGGRPNALVGVNELTSALELVDARTGVTRHIVNADVSDTLAPGANVFGANPLVVAGRYLVFVRDSTLYAAPFDYGIAKLRATPKAILSGVRLEAYPQTTHLALSTNGTLVWVGGGDGALSRFVWVTTDGQVRDTLPLPPAMVQSYALSRDGHRLAYSVGGAEKGSKLVVADLVRHVVDAATFSDATMPLNWVRHDQDLTVRFLTRDGIVHASSPTLTIDTTGVGIEDESLDGTIRCSQNGFIWRTPSAADSIRLDAGLNWCRFSPDGRMVAWDNPLGGYIAPVDGKDAGARRQYAPPGANEARWSRDGHELVYRAGNGWYAVRVPVTSEPAPAPRLLFRGQFNQALASWDIGPDGRFLLLLGIPPVRATHLNVITNFPRYVEQKLRGAK